MTTKSLKFAGGSNLKNQAVKEALYADDPNSRSPAFAIQAIFKLLKDAGVLEHAFELETTISDRIDEVIRDKVTWNERERHWQLGKGKHVSFEKIAQDATRWYIHDWDFKRHTRDTEVEYPEDIGNFFSEEDFKHLADTLMPSKNELTRRIFASPNHTNCLYYMDVVPLENDQFSAEFGRFDMPECHQVVEISKNFWNLEVRTILPLLQRGKVLSYTIHHISSKRGV